jgi:hypothetical protein
LVFQQVVATLNAVLKPFHEETSKETELAESAESFAFPKKAAMFKNLYVASRTKSKLLDLDRIFPAFSLRPLLP